MGPYLMIFKAFDLKSGWNIEISSVKLFNGSFASHNLNFKEVLKFMYSLKKDLFCF